MKLDIDIDQKISQHAIKQNIIHRNKIITIWYISACKFLELNKNLENSTVAGGFPCCTGSPHEPGKANVQRRFELLLYSRKKKLNK